MEQERLTFTILLDEEADAAKAYEVRGIPSTFFIGRDGVIRTRHTGPLDESVIKQYLQPLLQ